MTTETLTLTDFLLARIAEDEQAVQREQAHHLCWLASLSGPAAIAIPWFDYDRLFAECEAKRRIVELHRSWPVLVETEPTFDATDPTDAGSMTFRMSKQIAWTTEQAYRDHFGTEPPTGPILRALAAIYADHEDYREEWR